MARRVLEARSPAFREERSKVASVNAFLPTGIYVGGTAVHATLLDKDDMTISTKVAPTHDADLVLSHSDLVATAERLFAGLEVAELIAVHDRKFASSELVDNVVNYPFSLMHLTSEYWPASPLFANIDIFTERTGVAVIPVTEHLLTEGYDTIPIDSMQMRVAKPFYLIATHTHPYAFTNVRMNRIAYLMLQTFARDPGQFEEVIKMALEYIGLGGIVIQDMAEAMRLSNPEYAAKFMSMPEYAKYDEKVASVGHVVGTSQKNKIQNMAVKHIGLTTAEAQTVIATIADHFSSYRTPAREDVAQAVRRPDSREALANELRSSRA